MAIDVGAWLEQIGLGQYAGAFRDNDIDGNVLPALTAEDIDALGITSIGHRRRLLAAIEALREAAAGMQRPAPARSDRTAEPAEGGAAERRLLSILFCDLVGSTELATRRDAGDFREIIAA